jgi:hypothetical protein
MTKPILKRTTLHIQEMYEIFTFSRTLWLMIIIVYALSIILRAYLNTRKINLAEYNNWYFNDNNRSNPIKILYLRGFKSDGFPTKSIQELPLSMGYREFRHLGYEGTLAKRFYQIGHFIAVGLGEQASDIIGANRYYFNDEVWKENVLTLIKNASMIVLRPAFSKGITWEIIQIAKNYCLYKVVICFNPKEHNKSTYDTLKKGFGYHYQTYRILNHVNLIYHLINRVPPYYQKI